MKQRYEIINEALRMRAEIKKIFLDVDHWNRAFRKPSEVSIDPDPQGQMVSYLRSIEAGLQKELLCVHVEGPDELEACVSLEDADRRTVELNEYFKGMKIIEDVPQMRATVQAWPYSAEGHAEECKKLAMKLHEEWGE